MTALAVVHSYTTPGGSIEQSDEWAVGRRYFSLESLARLADTHLAQLPAVAAGASSDPS